MTTPRLLAVWLTAMPVHGYAPGCAPRLAPTSARAIVATPLFGRRQLLGSAAAFGSALLSAQPAAAVDEASALAIKLLDGASKELDGADALCQSGKWSELRDAVGLSLNAVVKAGVKARAAAIGGESEKALLAARATLLSSLQAADKVAYDEQKKSFSNSKALFNAEGTAARSTCPLGISPARLLCLLRARLVVLGSSACPVTGRPSVPRLLELAGFKPPISAP